MEYNGRMKRIGFIGAGKVGFSFGRHIKENAKEEYSVCGYFSRDPASARVAAEFAGGRAFETAGDLARECDLLLLTVPDVHIHDVWEGIQNAMPNGQLHLAHCSGSLDSRVFNQSGSTRFSFGSIHPLVAVCDRENAYKKLNGAYFTIEGDPSFTAFAENLLTTLGNPFSTISPEKKSLYHAASVMVSNHVCAIAYEGMNTFKACGLDEGFSENAWRALFLGNAENIARLGPVQALTGPVERGDTATVECHLNVLSGREKDLYILLSRTLIEIAQQKNASRDYSALISLLEDQSK